jgi:hypothetical protein
MEEPETLEEAVRYFTGSDKCLSCVVAHRWPDGVAGPTSGSQNVRFLATRRLWECKGEDPPQTVLG